MADVPTVIARPFVEDLHYGEAPRWHDGRLWYSDFYDRAVFSVADDGIPRCEVEVAGQPSGLGWLPDGRLLVVSMRDRALLRQGEGGALVRHGDLAPWAAFHANDMVVDAVGRAYVGSFGFDLDGFFEGTARPATTSLVRVDPDGTAHEAAPDLSFPNGCILSPDGRTLVVAETFALRLAAFEVADDGSLSNRRVWASLLGCAPDGICLDAEGCIWAANALAPECVRVTEGGEIVGRVVTGQTAFACMLGGPERRTLFCCTAPTSQSTEASAARNGRLEQADVEVPGAGLP
ncbi:MAG: SMP-30/gluconolactonase/LRE family protein [Acidimicrobiales bacterium]